MKPVWVWTENFGWQLLVMPDGYLEEEELSGKEKVQSLCDLAVILGMKAEEAEQATFSELYEFVDAHMGKED